MQDDSGPPIPLQATFELTPRCNFRCKMCYVNLQPDEIPAYGRELTADEWIGLGRQAQEAGILGLCITGGEPLVRPDFPEIYTALTDMGFLITLQTNLSLLEGELLELIKRRPPRAIKATLYGATNETYKRVCGVEHGLDRTLRGLTNAKEADIPLILVTTVIRENEQELEDMYRLAANYGLGMQHTHNVLPTLRAPFKPLEGSRIRFEDLTPGQQRATKPAPHQEIHSPLDACGNWKRAYWVLWNGRMSLCAHMPEPGIDLLATPLEEAWPQLLEKLELMFSPDACAGCASSRFCLHCPASILTEREALGAGKCQTARIREKIWKDK